MTGPMLFKEICASQKQVIGIIIKPSFPLKSVDLYYPWYLTALETLKTHGRTILALSFPDKNFS